MAEVDRVPELTAGWEERVASLSPEEGFLLSRIDGITPWASLRSVSGLPPERIDACLEGWLRDGLIQLAGPRPSAQRTPSGSRPKVDPALGLPVDVQQKALEFEARLEAPYHALLGVARDADVRDIKREYFKLCRDFHPDRYFAKQLGPFEAILHRIFKQINLAYELLRDPTTRAELERSMPAAPPPTGDAASPATAPQTFDKRQWLARMRSRFRLPDEVLAERRLRAGQLAESARVAQHQKNWKEAASCIRLAIAFDPWEEVHKQCFAEIQVEVNRVCAEELLAEATGAWDSRAQSQALKLYEEVLHYRPADAEAADRAAQLCIELDDFERAVDFAALACELRPRDASYQLTRGRALRRTGRRERAIEALTEATRLDPEDTQAAAELSKLRQRARRPGGGKP